MRENIDQISPRTAKSFFYILNHVSQRIRYQKVYVDQYICQLAGGSA